MATRCPETYVTQKYPENLPQSDQTARSDPCQDGVIRRKDELLTYECDGITGYRQRPALVGLPRSTAEIAAVVKLCHDNEIAWVARGAGTGLSGGALPLEEGILIVTARMNQILGVDLDNQRVVVQAWGD
jgi:glycolate oxidase